MLAITGAFGKQIDIMDAATGGYKSTYQILKELSQIWDDIDDQGRQSLLYTLGGARQVNVLSAILNNFSLAEETVISAANAAGSAMAENEKYLDSITGKINQLTASIEDLSTSLLNSELVKFILDLANGFIQLSDAVVDLNGSIPTFVGILTAFLSTHGHQLFGKNASGDLFFSLFGLLDLFDPSNKNSAIKEIDAFVAAMEAVYNTKPTIEQNQLNGLDLEKELKNYEALTDANRTLIQSQINSGKSFKDNLKIMSAYTKSIKDMTLAKQLATKAHKAFIAIAQGVAGLLMSMAIQAAIQGIISFVDDMYTTIEEHQEHIDEYAQSISNATSELKKLQDLQSQGIVLTDEDKARLEYLKDYVQLLKIAQQNEQRALVEKNLLSESINPFSSNSYEKAHDIQGGKWVIGYNEGLHYEVNNQGRYLASLDAAVTRASRDDLSLEEFESYRQQAIDTYELAVNDLVVLKEYRTELEAALPLYERGTEQYKRLSAEIDWANDAIDSYTNSFAKANQSGVIPGDYQYGGDSLHTYTQSNSWNIFQKYTSETVDGIVTDLQTAENAARQLELQLKDVSTTSFDEINKEIDSMQSALSVVTKASEEYAENGAYSLDTLQSLTEIDQRYIDLLIDENGQLSLNTEKIRDLATARVEELRVKIIQGAINQIEALTTEAACLDIITAKQVDSTTALREDTQALLEHTTAQMLSNAEFYNFGDSFKEAAKIIYDRTNAMIQAIDITDLFASSTSKAADAADDLNNALKDRGNLILKALDNRKKPLEDELDAIDEKKEALQDELDALNEIYEAEDREFELQKLKDAYERAKANKTVRLYTHDKGWQWVADPSEVKEAEDAYHEYLREIERDDARKAIQDQIDALDKSKEAIQDQIEAIDNLKEQVQEAMDNIGLTQEEYANNLALLAEFENATYDQLAEKVKAYASDVINSYNSMAQAAHEYNVQAAGTIELPEVIPQAGGSSTLGLGKPPPVPELRYHDGGLVKPQANVSNAFARYIDKLKLGEVPAILQQDEYVLTPNHQQAILDTHKGLINNLNHSKKNISLEIGDIIINNPVGNVSALSDAIIRQLPNQIMKDLYK